MSHGERPVFDELAGFMRASMSDAERGELLTRLDAYCDTAPRAAAVAEDHGAMVLFVAERGWPFYARPRLGRATDPSTDEIRAVLARQTELGLPNALEWVHESAPSLAERARAAGMTVQACPLLVLERLVEPRAPDGEIRQVDPEDVELGDVDAAITVAFRTPGTAVAEAGVAERDRVATSHSSAVGVGFTREAIREGRLVRVGAFVQGAGAVGGGGHNPRGEVSEIVGVGVLPSFRRRGLAAATAHLLAREALDRGVSTVFCAAESIDVARVYEGVGFRRIGTTCTAEVG